MKVAKFKYLLVLLLLLTLSFDGHSKQQEGSTDENKTCDVIEIFSQKGCPHCTRAYEFLTQLQQEHEQILVIPHDLHADPLYLERFVQLNAEHGVEHPGVPSFLICDQFLVGFDLGSTGVLIKQYLGLLPDQTKSGSTIGTSFIRVPLIGEIDPQVVGLLGLTIFMGLIDGFNPCAMWVLLFLLSLLVNVKDRKRILIIAGTFVIVSGAVYFAFMAAWLNLFLFLGYSRALQITIALIAILIGLVHIKDYFAFKKGLSLSIPESAKHGLYARVRRVVQADNLIAAMIAVFIIAVLVNFLELLCTAGLPVIYTQVLLSSELNTWQYYSYLLLYNLAYIFDDAVMVGIVIFTLHRLKIQERQGRWLKLISGVVILILGVFLLIAPDKLI